MKRESYKPGAGPTKELSIRVSVASLVRVLFKNPSDGNMMIALERTATLIKNAVHSVVVVKAKPFGGAVRILKIMQFKELVGDFHFDSERSSEEQDFRIQIHRNSWEKVKDICKEHLKNNRTAIIEISPVRELSEEFYDCLRVKISPEDYDLKTGGLKTEDRLTPTDNIHAPGVPTNRVYFIFEAVLKNPRMIEMIMDNTRYFSDQDLEKKAWEDAKNGGKGRANAVLALYLAKLEEFYRSNQNKIHQTPLLHEGYQLDTNVQMILNFQS